MLCFNLKWRHFCEFSNNYGLSLFDFLAAPKKPEEKKPEEKKPEEQKPEVIFCVYKL